jgi:hypothetical protein
VAISDTKIAFGKNRITQKSCHALDAGPLRYATSN